MSVHEHMKVDKNSLTDDISFECLILCSASEWLEGFRY